MPAAHEIYNEELRGLRRGDALYHPEPVARALPPEIGSDDNQPTVVYEVPVRIGDVGYTKQGAFYRLFNAGRSADDPINSRWGVPDGFEPLGIGDPLFFDAELEAGPLHGKTIFRASLDVGIPGCVT
jgi:hypothetical protein